MSRQDLDSALDAPPVPDLGEHTTVHDDVVGRAFQARALLHQDDIDPMDAPAVPQHLMIAPTVRHGPPPRRAKHPQGFDAFDCDLGEPPSFADDDFANLGDDFAIQVIVPRPRRHTDRTLAVVSGGMVMSMLALIGMLITQ